MNENRKLLPALETVRRDFPSMTTWKLKGLRTSGELPMVKVAGEYYLDADQYSAYVKAKFAALDRVNA